MAREKVKPKFDFGARVKNTYALVGTVVEVKEREFPSDKDSPNYLVCFDNTEISSWWSDDELESVPGGQPIGQPRQGTAAATDYATRDSGAREEWETGSKRDTRVSKGRYDLLPVAAIRRLAELLERGADKYGDRNWQLGQPLSRFVDSGLRHAFQVADGEDDEDHAAAVLFNFAAYIYTLEKINLGELPPELDDVGASVARPGVQRVTGSV